MSRAMASDSSTFTRAGAKGPPNSGALTNRGGRFLDALTLCVPQANQACDISGYRGGSYAELLARYDTPATLFYLDPPYWQCETDYGTGVFAPADFSRLATLLAGLKGQFLMSINDAPQIREIFAAFDIEEVDTVYTIGAATAGPADVKELLIGRVRGRRDLFSQV